MNDTLARMKLWALAIVAQAPVVLWGGMTAGLWSLLAMIALDYVTGVLAAVVEAADDRKAPAPGRPVGLSSRVGFVGLLKKLAIVLAVSAVYWGGQALPDDMHKVLFDVTVVGFVANEFISVVENLGRIGVPLPPGIQQLIAALRRGAGDGARGAGDGRDAASRQ